MAYNIDKVAYELVNVATNLQAHIEELKSYVNSSNYTTGDQPLDNDGSREVGASPA